MNGSTVLLVLVGVALLVAAIYRGGASDSSWARFKRLLTRVLLVVGGILVLVVAFTSRPGNK